VFEALQRPVLVSKGGTAAQGRIRKPVPNLDDLTYRGDPEAAAQKISS
jgi:hypothetical protein